MGRPMDNYMLQLMWQKGRRLSVSLAEPVHRLKGLRPPKVEARRVRNPPIHRCQSLAGKAPSSAAAVIHRARPAAAMYGAS